MIVTQNKHVCRHNVATLLSFALAGLFIVAMFLASGCISQPLPKDANIVGFKNKITTPWGSSDISIDELNTGAAARNVTKGEVPGK